jgi:hypothetical protein
VKKLWVDLGRNFNFFLLVDLIIAWIATLDLASVNGLELIGLFKQGVFTLLADVLKAYALCQR